MANAGRVRPVYKGKWSSTQSYEILDVVSNADSTAVYMAKQNVPAGTAVTNDSYWDKFMTIEDIGNRIQADIYQLHTDLEIVSKRAPFIVNDKYELCMEVE